MTAHGPQGTEVPLGASGGCVINDRETQVTDRWRVPEEPEPGVPGELRGPANRPPCEAGAARLPAAGVLLPNQRLDEEPSSSSRCRVGFDRPWLFLGRHSQARPPGRPLAPAPRAALQLDVSRPGEGSCGPGGCRYDDDGGAGAGFWPILGLCVTRPPATPVCPCGVTSDRGAGCCGIPGLRATGDASTEGRRPPNSARGPQPDGWTSLARRGRSRVAPERPRLWPACPGRGAAPPWPHSS